MGQRHQIYIRIENPLKKKELTGAVISEADKQEAELYFGKSKYSVIPFHHQWLFGTTAVGLLVSVMKRVYEAKGDSHPFSPDLSYIPYRKNYSSTTLEGYGLVELIKGLISVTDFEVSEIGGRFGVESLTYIGDEHYNYETKKVSRKWANHQKSCDNGDNNDGIMIIDVPSKKYCFMNIYDQDKTYTSANSLPKLEPVSALDYQKAYYPTKKHSDVTAEEILNNKEMVKNLKPLVEKFEVLSLTEVKKMFPKTYREFKKEKLAKAK